MHGDIREDSPRPDGEVASPNVYDIDLAVGFVGTVADPLDAARGADSVGTKSIGYPRGGAVIRATLTTGLTSYMPYSCGNYVGDEAMDEGAICTGSCHCADPKGVSDVGCTNLSRIYRIDVADQFGGAADPMHGAEIWLALLLIAWTKRRHGRPLCLASRRRRCRAYPPRCSRASYESAVRGDTIDGRQMTGGGARPRLVATAARVIGRQRHNATRRRSDDWWRTKRSC